MKTARHDIPVLIDALGAKIQFLSGFGTATGPLSAEHFELEAGVDNAPLLVGLEDDACQVPHWGYVISGHLTVSYRDGTQESCSTGDLVFWPAGHTLRADEDSELVLFSPQADHRAVISHMGERMATMPA